MRTQTAPTFDSFFMAGFECSSHRRRDGVRLDLIRATGHDRHVLNDYRQCRELGLTTLRDGLRWHRIETAAGKYDWSSWLPMLEALKAAQSAEGDRLYEKVFFDDKVKFQYPPTSLVYLSALELFGLASIDALNAINAVVFAATCAGFAYLVLLLLQPDPAQIGSLQRWAVVPALMLAALVLLCIVLLLNLGARRVIMRLGARM